MIPLRTCWLISKTTTVSWFPISFLNAKTSSIRQTTIIGIWSWLYSLLLNKPSSFLTLTGLKTHSFKTWILLMFLFTGQERSDWQSTSGIAWQHSRRHALDSNRFLDRTSRNMRDIQPQRWRHWHVPHEHRVQCGCSPTESPAAGASTNRETTNNSGTSQSCGQHGAKHT